MIDVITLSKRVFKRGPAYGGEYYTPLSHLRQRAVRRALHRNSNLGPEPFFPLHSEPKTAPWSHKLNL